ncbi:MAG TPA: acetyl-CoA C-acetyltransferase [Chloroflexi bacterium]|jgi:acetyl-CoA C-acetyltransferase|nr:acetyl-CoA C-acetyltransferase [Chloroflexota bacterium]HAL26596.1 acetyl-CoA C-acetyltransferase [Chloroflexota bacterium]
MTDGSVILGAARTPIGAFLGGLAPLTAPELGAIAIKCAVERSGVAIDQIDEVFMGSVVQAGVGQAPARQASLGAGLPKSVPCTTINKVCGSGLKAVMLAASQIAAGEYGVIVAGGMESMSSAPYLLRGLRQGLSLGEHSMEDANLTDGLVDAYGGGHMGLGGEKAAAKSGLSRADQDRFAVRSYQKALAAQRMGAFDDEIVPVEVKGRKGQVTRVEKDETPRETSFEALAGLTPAFKAGGTVTAGNASKLSDGAAALVVAGASRARALGAAPLARIVAQAQYAHEPDLFLLAPSGAIARVLEKAGWTADEVDLYEVNEAFSGVEAVRLEIGIAEDRFNVNGGAVALGHPIGSSGARLLVTLLYALRARGKQRGIVSLCLGGGEAVALAVEVL